MKCFVTAIIFSSVQASSLARLYPGMTHTVWLAKYCSWMWPIGYHSRSKVNPDSRISHSTGCCKYVVFANAENSEIKFQSTSKKFKIWMKIKWDASSIVIRPNSACGTIGERMGHVWTETQVCTGFQSVKFSNLWHEKCRV